MDSKFTSNPNFVSGIRKKWSHYDLFTPDSKMGGAYRKRLLSIFRYSRYHFRNRLIKSNNKKTKIPMRLRFIVRATLNNKSFLLYLGISRVFCEISKQSRIESRDANYS